jgi:hypothetical protein
MFDDIAADLLGADHPTIAQFAAQRPKSVIGVPGHRREEQGRIDDYIADGDRL